MEQIKNVAWVEKYRPDNLNDVVGVDTSVLKKLCEDPHSMPHILLHSKSPGTGKTTIARAIIKTIGAESLFLNASDERRIEDVREKIKRFVQCMSNNNVPRIVFLDECDGMIKGSQEALRSIMEQYPAKFILTCNNLEKIIEPIQSRCTKIHLGLPKKEEILGHVKGLCEKENLQFEDEALKKLVTINYPSIRDMINQMQILSLTNERLTLDIVHAEKEEYEKLYSLIKEGKLQDARTNWLEKGLPVRDVLHSIFNYIWKDNFSIDVTKKLVNLIAEADYRMAVNADQDITMFWFSMKMREIIKNA